MIKAIRRLYNRFFSPEKELARRLRRLLGFTPAYLNVFKLAFAHKSNNDPQAKSPYGGKNNERLEYLGDAVLGTIVAEYLYKKYPTADEGFLTKMRSKIVKRKSLNTIGYDMGLDELLSTYNNTRIARSMLGNAVEALVGAVYVEQGYVGTMHFVVQRMLRDYVDIETLETYDDNYKSQLLEHCQKNGQKVDYEILKRFKQDKRDRFRVAVTINGQQMAVGEDFNKKSAEQLASRRALKDLGLKVEAN
ncbi:ribonuclease-3 [Neolewinella xylanilytica]|uniref:Ribonuclease 3 n=1 Tax=Neolewinella xylanilytica TaxID=1514080 RepID=A0A2S6IAL2_9BACT|nr:ribonuclease III [Neolewinella xylanilytica]PPK88544.1 ribonuclease-3 [Neolewinella xylanilytica]